MVSGASCVSYWLATYTWDLITYAATVAITMLIFELYQDKSFIGSWTKAGATFAVLMSFGASVIPLTYCYSFGFSNHANAQVGIIPIPRQFSCMQYCQQISALASSRQSFFVVKPVFIQGRNSGSETKSIFRNKC